jgi:Protein of unknown function (DUF1580)
MSMFLALFLLGSVFAAPGLIDVANEPLITLAQLARRLPRRRKDRPVAPSTIHRWRAPGIKGVRLECVRVGGAWCTNLRAFQKFCDRLSELGDPHDGTVDDLRNETAVPKVDGRQARVERELDQKLGG